MKTLMMSLTILSLVACNKSHGSSSPTAAITSIAFPTAEAASLPDCTPAEGQSVIWVKDTGKLMFCSPESKWVEISVSANSIDAKNVKLGSVKLGLADAPAKTAGYLSATNMQDAMAVVATDLNTVLPGNWTVVNKTRTFDFSSATGSVSFANGQISIGEGAVTSLGIEEGHCGAEFHDESYSYEIVNGNVLIVRATAVDGLGNAAGVESIIKITAQDNDTLLVTGSGLCNLSNKEQLSILSRVK